MFFYSEVVVPSPITCPVQLSFRPTYPNYPLLPMIFLQQKSMLWPFFSLNQSNYSTSQERDLLDEEGEG